MKIDIKVDVEAARQRLNYFQRSVIPKATAAALNRTGDYANTLTVRDLSKVTGLKQKDVRTALNRVRATWNNLEYRLAVIGKALNLIRFSARQTKKGVSASAWGKRKIYRGTFIANQGRTVFVRTSKARLPIRPVYGPSLPREFGRTEFLGNLRKAIIVKWRAEFERQLNYYLTRGK
jgi:hypothetical protein